METLNVESCPTCNTPLDADRVCITCRAAADGLVTLTRSGYASVKEMLDMLARSELTAQIEQIPARRPEEKVHGLWNLYIQVDQAEKAASLLRAHWAELIDDPAAAAAAERGAKGLDLDAGGEIDCPACAHHFTLNPASPECPDCGLSLGAPSDSSPDEVE